MGTQVDKGLQPENVVVVVNEDSWASRALADAYVSLRAIPARNVISLGGLPHFETIGVDGFREQILAPVLAAIDARGLRDTIDCIAYSADIPYEINFRTDLGADKVRAQVGDRGSLTGMTYLHAAVSAGDVRAYAALDSNRYARRAVADEPETPRPEENAAASEKAGRPARATRFSLNTRRFRAQTAWDATGMPSDGADAKRYMLSTMLGVTSGRGTSLREAVAALERAAAADGTRPAGTVYYMVNGDIRSRTRRWGFAEAVRMLKEEGVAAVIEEGVLPQGHADIAGAMVGIAVFDFAASASRILPGAICEHLTSTGGVVVWSDFQTPLTEFLRHGAAGASGTVMEPLAIQAKFPDPFIHVHYVRGASLAEAFYQSVAAPYQLLIVGDPLCRPWGKAPDAPAGRPALDAGPVIPADAALQPETWRRGLRVVGSNGVYGVSGVDREQAWWSTAGITAGVAVTVECFVEAVTNDIYQFQVFSAGGARVVVDGQPLQATGRGAWQMFPAALATGWHAVSIRITAAGGGDAPRAGAPVELRFGAAGVRPLEQVSRCELREGDTIGNVGVRLRLRLDEATEAPLDARIGFGIEGLEGLADGVLTMSWQTEKGSGWSVEPARAEVPVSGGACEPAPFRIRFEGDPFVSPGFLPQPLCVFHLERDVGPEPIAAHALPLAFMFKTKPRPRIAVPRAVQPPKLDGVLDDAAWAGAATVQSFLTPKLDQPAAQPTATWLAWDEHGLYAAFRCTEPELDALHLTARYRDDSVSVDDSIELFVDADGDAKTYHQVMINPAGVIYDGAGWDSSWNGQFEVATGRADGAWTVELAIPWATLGATPPASGATLRVLFVRNRVLNAIPELSMWPCAPGGNHQPQFFGAAVLQGDTH
ncbi:MAG: TIGR03790 family protein [Verrucomicrobia bacterium]|nr:TIGR03790 family protein [Verrucomicrobiota bacterium]